MELSISSDKKIDANKLVTGRTCIIGQSGSGKSYTVAVFCEELARKNIGFCIIDTEGEYFSLKEKYPILWVGSNLDCEVDINEVNFSSLADKILKKDFPTILDVSDVNDPQKTVSDFLKAIYKTSGKMKKPFLIIVEEIDKFAPQRGDVVPEIEEISKRGRKRGIGLMIATQRPALVSKNILSQCGNQIVGKLTIKNDIDSVKLFFPNKKDLEKLPMLTPGLFFVQGEIISEPKIVEIRERKTTHKASTPKLMKTKLKQTTDLEKLKDSLKKEDTEENIEVEEVKTIGLKPKISDKQAFDIIKRKTNRFKFFGKEALVSKLTLILRPIFSCEIKYLKKKLIGREILNTHIYFDGITGNIISFNKKFSVICNLNGFLGLSSNELEVFRIISSKKKVTTTEMSNILGRSTESIRISLKKLKSKNLIHSKREGRSITYSSFTKSRLPKINKISSKKLDTGRLYVKAKKLEPLVSLEDLSSIIRALGEKAEIVSERKIYYPIYEATIIKKNKEKKIFLDAISGKIIKIENLY